MKKTHAFTRIISLVALMFWMNVYMLHAQGTQMTANQILKVASEQAAKENKKVFVIFHASWCGWCHRMDSIMNAADCNKLFTDNYVVTHLTVMESPTKKNLENPGAMDLLAKYNGDKQGIPFWLIFDKDGKLLADAQARPEGVGLDQPGKNTGCPNTPEEIAHFIKVLKQTSNLNSDQLGIVERSFAKK